MTIKLIIGLRNPGLDYEKTRHNAGGMFVSALADRHRCSFKLDKKMQAQITDVELDHCSCKLALPMTFMNHSGRVVRSITQFYRIEPEEILVAHDDLDLPLGCARLKSGGGHGGHNGLRDITALLGSSLFQRLRFGIGHPGHKELVHQYVLSKPSLEEKRLLDASMDRAMDVMPLVLSGDLPRAMNHLNQGLPQE